MPWVAYTVAQPAYVPPVGGPVPYSPQIDTLVAATGHDWTVTWVAPDMNADGSTPVVLTSNTVYWGTTQGEQQQGGAYTGSASVGAGALTYTSSGLGANTWWVAVSATNANGESWSSPEVSIAT